MDPIKTINNYNACGFIWSLSEELIKDGLAIRIHPRTANPEEMGYVVLVCLNEYEYEKASIIDLSFYDGEDSIVVDYVRGIDIRKTINKISEAGKKIKGWISQIRKNEREANELKAKKLLIERTLLVFVQKFNEESENPYIDSKHQKEDGELGNWFDIYTTDTYLRGELTLCRNISKTEAVETGIAVSHNGSDVEITGVETCWERSYLSPSGNHTIGVRETKKFKTIEEAMDWEFEMSRIVDVHLNSLP